MYPHLKGVVQTNHYQLVDVVQVLFLRVQSYFIAEIPCYHWPKILRNCSSGSYAYKCTSFTVFYCCFCSNCFKLWRIGPNSRQNPIFFPRFGLFLGNAYEARQVIRVNTING